jgi:hypothetical protein
MNTICPVGVASVLLTSTHRLPHLEHLLTRGRSGVGNSSPRRLARAAISGGPMLHEMPAEEAGHRQALTQPHQIGKALAARVGAAVMTPWRLVGLVPHGNNERTYIGPLSSEDDWN